MRGGRFSKWITIGSLAGLAAGLALGLLAHRAGNPQLHSFVRFLEPFAAVWLKALQIIVFPLIVSVLLVSIASTDRSERPGRMGALTLAGFFSILCLGALFSFIAASLLVSGFRIEPSALRR